MVLLTEAELLVTFITAEESIHRIDFDAASLNSIVADTLRGVGDLVNVSVRSQVRK